MWEQAARSKCPISRAEADIVAQRQLRIGIIAAHQPVDHAAECRSLQTQFLREGLELPESAGIAIEQVSGVIVIIAGILGLILAIGRDAGQLRRSEEHTSELQSLMRISYAVFCFKKKNTHYLL